MRFSEYIDKLEEMVKDCELIKKQLYGLQVLQFAYIREKYQIDQEYRSTFDLQELLDDYSWKARKCHYFVYKYLVGVLKELNCHREHIESLTETDYIFYPKSSILDEAVYNFDAFVLAACAIMEPASKDYMATHLRKKPVTSYYPKKKQIGLYWQMNLLRNRIVHHTGGRFENGSICQRYVDFSSRINGVEIRNENIALRSTQIDVYRSKEVQKTIATILETGSDSNVFDCLFPEKTGKGHEKKNPGLLVCGETVYFDHATSGVRFVSEILQFLLNMNNAFFVELSHRLKNKAIILEICTVIYENEAGEKWHLSDLFDISQIPM